MKRLSFALLSALVVLGGSFGVAHAVSILIVQQGGTGQGSFQTGKLIYGNGTGALATTSGETLGYVLQWNGSKPTWVATTTLGFPTGGGGTPGGLNAQIQYNNAGVFGGIAGATTDGTAVSLNAAHLLNPTINGAGTGLATLVYPNTSTSATITVPAITGTLALTSQLTTGTISTSTPLVNGQVDFSTGANTIGNDSSFFWDAADHRLGIGTTTPQTALHIVSSANDGAMIQNFTGTATNLDLATGDVLSGTESAYFKFGINNSGNFQIRDAKNLKTPFVLEANAPANALYVAATGDVGISSSTPGSLFSIGTTNGINFSTATSTFSSTGGINLTSGCFAIGGVCVGGGGGTPGGSNTQVQYNNAGAFGGISGMTTNGTNTTFAGGSLILAGASTGTASVQYASTALSGGTFNFPGINSTQTVAVLGLAQTFTADTTFSSINGNFGSSVVSSTYQLGYGATISGQTKTLNIGTGGVSGSATAINIGSAFGTTIKFNNLGSGLLNATSGVLGLATAGTDYQVPITLTTTGSSGAATFIGNTLNVPQYAGTTYAAGTGLTLTTGTFSVNTSQNISTLSNLSTAGFVKTNASGLLSVDTNTYLTGNQTITLSGAVSGSGTTAITTSYAGIVPSTLGGAGSVSGILKANGSGTVTAAAAGTDYLVPTGSGAGLTGIPTSVSNSDSTLTISPTIGAVVASLNLAHANTWTGLQTFKNTSNGSATIAFLDAAGGTSGELRIGTTSAQSIYLGHLTGGGATGVQNTAFGYADMTNGAFSGNENNAMGSQILTGLTTGSNNNAMGYAAMNGASTASNDTAVGSGALNKISTGSGNTSIGYQAGVDMTTGSNNIIIGQSITVPSITSSQQMNIGGLIFGLNAYGGATNSSTTASGGLVGIGTTSPLYPLQIANATGPQLGLSDGSGNSNQWVFRNEGGTLAISTSSAATGATSTPSAIEITSSAATHVGIATTTTTWTFGVNGSVSFQNLGTAAGTVHSVCIDATNHQLEENTGASCTVSSKRFKHDIEPLDVSGIDDVMAMKPSSFVYNEDASNTIMYGFVAEDMAAIDPKLVGYDASGAVNSIDDIGVQAIVVKALQEQEARIDALSGEAAKSMEDDWQWLAIGLLAIGFAYQQVQIRKLKS